MCKKFRVYAWRKWLVLIGLLLLGGLVLQSQVVRAAPSSAPLLGFTPTPTPTLTGTPPAHPTPTSTPQAERADPVITKRGGPSEAYPGEEVTFGIEVTNSGQHAAVGVVVTDEIPEYFDILEATTSQGTVTVEGRKVTVNVGIVGPGFVVEIVIRTRLQQDAPTPLTLENVAILNSPNGGSITTPPVIITVPGPLLPVTGRASFSGVAYVVLGMGLVILGLWLGIRERTARSWLG